MSRQILSYADLGPIVSVTTPIPGPSSPHRRSPSRDEDSPSEPPRKRVRINTENGDANLPYSALPRDENNGEGVAFHENGNANANANGSGRKGKKSQRPGNPSGVPWTQHWDAQVQVAYDRDGGEATGGLAYEDEDEGATMVHTSTSTSNVGTATHRGGRSAPHSGSNRWNGGGGLNGSNGKAMPPPPGQPPSFDGPIISPSTNVVPGGALEHRATAGTLSDPAGNARGKNGNGNGNGRSTRAKTKTKGKDIVSLINEEEWDDSALIDAWNAAEEEYREMNGGKKWRCEPVKHSSLWHDEFHEDTDEEPSDDDDGYESDRGGDGGLQDSHPFDVIAEAIVEESYEVDESSLTRAQVSFGHTSSGNMPLPPPHPHAHPSTSAPEVLFPIGSPPVPLPMPVGTTRSSIMEEAFRRAQEASYTAGYWTAVYQMHASQQDPPVQAPEKKLNGVVKGDDEVLVDDFVNEGEEGEIGEEEGGFVPTQR